jgi:hypothetical protein
MVYLAEIEGTEDSSVENERWELGRFLVVGQFENLAAEIAITASTTSRDHVVNRQAIRNAIHAITPTAR